MVSFIIIAADEKKRREYIDIFCKEKQIDPFDKTIITKEESKQSLGIDDVKQMQKKLFLKPIRSQTKAIVIEDSQLLTVEAQNALLKVLEEPPAQTIIFLSADSEEALLLTIRSRCQLIKLHETVNILNTKEKEAVTSFIDELNSASIPQVMKIAERLAKEKTKAIEKIAKTVFCLHERLIEQPKSKLVVRQLKSLQKLHRLLKTTNVNPRFAIEATLLEIISQKEDDQKMQVG